MARSEAIGAVAFNSPVENSPNFPWCSLRRVKVGYGCRLAPTCEFNRRRWSGDKSQGGTQVMLKKGHALALAVATAGLIGFGAPLASAATMPNHAGAVNVSNNQAPLQACGN